MAGSDYVVVLTTVPVDTASELATTLVERRVAACVSVLPEMRSVYRWEGSVEQEREHQLVIKTTRGRVESLWACLREQHPYDVPEFLVLPVVDGSESYLRWIRESTTE